MFQPAIGERTGSHRKSIREGNRPSVEKLDVPYQKAPNYSFSSSLLRAVEHDSGARCCPSSSGLREQLRASMNRGRGKKREGENARMTPMTRQLTSLRLGRGLSFRIVFLTRRFRTVPCWRPLLISLQGHVVVGAGGGDRSVPECCGRKRTVSGDPG